MAHFSSYEEQVGVGLTRPYSPDFPLRRPRSIQEDRPKNGFSIRRKPVEANVADPNSRVASAPSSPYYLTNSSENHFLEASSTQVETLSPAQGHLRIHLDHQSNALETQHGHSSFAGVQQQLGAQNPRVLSNSSSNGEVPIPWADREAASPRLLTPSPEFVNMNMRNTSGSGFETDNPNGSPQSVHMLPALQYHHQRLPTDKKGYGNVERRASQDAAGSAQNSSRNSNGFLFASNQRPQSSSSAPLETGHQMSPGRSAKRLTGTPLSQDRHSPNARPLSYVDLLTLPYAQQAPPTMKFSHSHLQGAVGKNASLLSTKQTLDMYRANVKKTNDQIIQYSFAIFMIETAIETRRETDSEAGALSAGMDPSEMITEARHILQRLSDKSYPFAQYYLADGYSTGLFSKGKPDDDKAFPLFVAASKHGHAESGYRAALCYEYGWGTRKDPLKAVQFYRQSASKNHPGCMMRLSRACLSGDMGLGHRYREGLKWLKRAAESADAQYNSAPYELGLLHESGYGDDIFPDEAYAAQLFTQSAELGHADASFRLGDAYEHGKLKCPHDPALSVHFYNLAAQRGHAAAMMALCAWYMVGAPPVLEKSENEAYEWASRSAALGLPKAEYAVGYFTEMGIGCRRDPLEANVWYVRAADQGEERAKRRIAAIQVAASGGPPPTSVTPPARGAREGRKSRIPPMVGEKPEEGQDKPKRWGIF